MTPAAPRPGRGASVLVVSVHDVAPATGAAIRAWCALLDERGVPASLLVVPGPWRAPTLVEDQGLVRWLRDRVAGGDEVVLHGWAHRAGPEGAAWRRAAGRLIARGAAEFGALDEPEAYRRLAAGRGVLDALDLGAVGFTPPGWLGSPGTRRALCRLGFRYTTSHLGVLDLRSGRRQPAFALSHRPGGAGERLGARWLVGFAERAARRGRPVRIALHPDDLYRPSLRAASLTAIDTVLRLGGRPTTYSGLLAARRSAAGRTDAGAGGPGLGGPLARPAAGPAHRGVDRHPDRCDADRGPSFGDRETPA